MKKILVRGPALSQSGYGEQCRFALRALRKFPERFDVFLINTGWGKTGWIWEDNEERQWFDSIIQKTLIYQQQGGKFDISLQVCIPNEWQKMAPVNIGYTAGIETTKISPQWFQGCLNVNKILLTSNHAKFGFVNAQYPATDNVTGQQFLAKLDTPMEVVPYPVRVYEEKPIDLDLKNDFNFLIVAQWGVRKNIDNTLRWWLDEFSSKEVGLVLKLSSINNSLMDREMTTNRLKAILESHKDAKTRKCSIHLLHGDLKAEEMTYLYRHPKIKALISLTHGEGFGLPLFEGVYNGLPLIAPAWGGQTDFIYMPIKDKKKNKVKNTCMIANVSYDIGKVQPEAVWDGVIIPESQWCFAKEFHFKQQLRDVHKNYGQHKSKATKLQKHILEAFDSDKMLAHFADCVDEHYNVLNIADYMTDTSNDSPLKEVVNYD